MSHPACHVLSSSRSRAGQFKQAFSFKCRFLFPAALCRLNDSVITRGGNAVARAAQTEIQFQTANCEWNWSRDDEVDDGNGNEMHWEKMTSLLRGNYK